MVTAGHDTAGVAGFAWTGTWLIGGIAAVLLAVSIAGLFHLWLQGRRSPERRLDLVANLVTGAIVAFALFGVQFLVEEHRQDRARQESLELLVEREDDLSGIELRGRDLSRLYLADKHFDEADLSDASFANAVLDGTTFKGATLIDADLPRASLRRVVFEHANLRSADLSEADLTQANLRFADLREANLEGARVFRADLFGADLRGATLTGAVMIDSSLRRANLKRAAGSATAKLHGAEYDYLTRWELAEPCGATTRCRLPPRQLLADFATRVKQQQAPVAWKVQRNDRNTVVYAGPRQARLTANRAPWTDSAEAFATRHRRRLGMSLRDFRELDLRSITVRDGGIAYRLMFDFRETGRPITVIHVYYVESGFAYDFTATSWSEDFLRLETSFDRLLAPLLESEPGLRR